MAAQISEQLGSSQLRRVEATLQAEAARLVGELPLDRTRDKVARAMLREALLRTGGNYAGAASLLGVKRQAVQQMVRRWELRGWVENLKKPTRL